MRGAINIFLEPTPLLFPALSRLSGGLPPPPTITALSQITGLAREFDPDNANLYYDAGTDELLSWVDNANVVELLPTAPGEVYYYSNYRNGHGVVNVVNAGGFLQAALPATLTGSTYTFVMVAFYNATPTDGYARLLSLTDTAGGSDWNNDSSWDVFQWNNGLNGLLTQRNSNFALASGTDPLSPYSPLTPTILMATLNNGSLSLSFYITGSGSIPVTATSSNSGLAANYLNVGGSNDGISDNLEIYSLAWWPRTLTNTEKSSIANFLTAKYNLY